MQQEITKEMIKDWQGSDNLKVDDFLGLLVSLANGEYPIAVFKSDVLGYYNANKE